VRLTVQQSYELLERHEVFALEICDRCGAVLGAIRFTRKDESGVWCSRECRGDVHTDAARKGGRPRRYRSEDERIAAERLKNSARQKAFRLRVQRNGKPPRTATETKDLQAQKSPLSAYPLTPLFPALGTDSREFQRPGGLTLLRTVNA
jgi:hypothetical protein